MQMGNLHNQDIENNFGRWEEGKKSRSPPKASNNDHCRSTKRSPVACMSL